MRKSWQQMANNEPTCCCEYKNKDGEISHILATCCNCEAFDELVDHCLRCQPIPQDICDAFLSTVDDRFRIPSCLGSGAVKVRIDILMVFFIVAGSLYLATINSVFLIISLTIMPSRYLYLQVRWLKDKGRTRTSMFFVWGLISTILVVMINLYHACVLDILFSFKVIIGAILVLAMFCALVAARSNPGTLGHGSSDTCCASCPKSRTPDTTRHESSNLTDVDEEQNKTLDGSSPLDHAVKDADYDTRSDGPSLGVIGQFFIENLDVDRQELKSAMREKLAQLESPGDKIHLSDVTWIDTRPVQGDMLVTWCMECNTEALPRSAHCPVCKSCILLRDHHCLWIDTCVGSDNHRSFLLTIILFVVSGCYGIHFTLSTVSCHSLTSYLECDFMSRLSLVAVVYSLEAVVGIGIVLLNQIILISQGITGNEMAVAARHRWVSYAIFATHNAYNQGFLRNWTNFLRKRRPTYDPLEHVV